MEKRAFTICIFLAASATAEDFEKSNGMVSHGCIRV